MIIETGRLILRPFKEADKEPYAALGANETAMHNFPSTMNKFECDSKMNTLIKLQTRYGFHFLAAELKQTNQFVGLLGLANIDVETKLAIPGRPNMEIGWALHPDTWGKGLAPEGARACLTYAWEVLKLNEVVSFTAKTNTPSQRVMEKIGMTRDPEDDFDHPKMPAKHPLTPHVLYRIANPAAKAH